MSLNQPVLLDIQLPAKEIILQKFNVNNALNLVVDDFDFGVPAVYVPTTVGSKLNTKVTLTPKLSSKYYNSFDIFYTRMDISTILSNNVSVPRDGALVLTDLISSINTLFGIHLVGSDYVEKTLPTLDPMDPDAPVDVLVEMKPESLLFFGSHTLTLNSIGGGGEEPVEEEPVTVYALVSHPYDSVRSQTIECFTSLGETVPNYQFMRNATSITLVSIMRFVLLPNNDLLLQGHFEFSMLVGSAPTNINTDCFVMAPNGAVKRVTDSSNDFGFTNNLNWRYQCRPGSNKVYATDFNILTRFNLDGTPDTGYNPAALGYQPRGLREDIDGNLYVMSGNYWIPFDDDNNPGTPMVDTLAVRIDRLTPAGALDLTFTPVIIRMTGGIGATGVWPISGFALIESEPPTPTPGGPTKVADGFYISLLPDDKPTTKSDVPIINNVPVIPPDPNDEIEEYGFAPVFRFFQTGIWDTTFDHKQKSLTPDSISIPDNRRVSEVPEALGVYNKQPVWFTNLKNPVTGHIHQMPVRFKENGKMEFISGDGYYDSYRWNGAESITVLKDGNILICGDVFTRNPDGSWKDTVDSFVGSYNASTTPDDVVYDPPDAGGGPSFVRSIAVV